MGHGLNEEDIKLYGYNLSIIDCAIIRKIQLIFTYVIIGIIIIYIGATLTN
mgnify:CR=1 FL=1